ncbi:MAG: enoyl-CoA hydratase/isomerase family protein [Flavobacteriales bacterium]
MESGHVRYSVSNGIGTIVFYHPQSNSLPGTLLQELGDVIQHAGKDSDSQVLILRSEGEKAFCAGASFDELVAIQDLAGGQKFFSGFAHVILSMRSCPKLIIGRVHNKAVGGGVGLASSVDYCFATEKASIKLSELAVGIGPFVVGPAVERKMGLSAMSQLAIDATSWRSAAWAREKGLYQDVFENEAAMDQAIDALADKLMKSNPEAMRDLKTIFWRNTDDWPNLLHERAGISGRLVLSEFTRNAIQQFKAKA